MTLGRNPEGRDLRVRYFWLGGFFLLGLVVLAINLYRLMVVRHDEFLALSEDNQFKDVRIRAPRGRIKDRRGETLVDVRPSFDAFVTPAFCQKCVAEVLPRMGDLLGWSDAERERAEGLVRAARGPQRYQPLAVAVDLSRDGLDVLQAHLHELPGVEVERVPHRHYLAGPALAHVLGYMNEVNPDELVRLNQSSSLERPPYALGDYIGRRGVERAFETDLRGNDGWRKVIVNARGEVLAGLGRLTSRDEVVPRPGQSVVLSIDARLQAEAERVFPGEAGAIVVLEAKTGFVLAIVSRPAFDPNQLTGRVSSTQLAAMARDPLQPMVFRAAAQHYSPGSTFKPITLLAGLQSGAFTPDSTATCVGGYRLGSRVWRCHKESGHGAVAARKALQVSCDTYFYKVADTVGIDPIGKMGRAFGLGAPTNLGVAAEVPGIMPDSAWHDRVTPGGYTKGMALNTAIGQGDVNLTPLQLAVVYAALGNGGDVFQPQVVKRIEAPDGKLIREFEPNLVRHVPITPEQHRVVVDALTAVVNEAGGTAYRSRLKDLVYAGKTGTAQVARLGKTRLKKHQMDYFARDHAWFSAFAPANDPEIAVVVLNEHGGHGGSDAAPAASQVIAKYFELKRSDSVAFGPGYTAPANAGPPVSPPRAAPREVLEPRVSAPALAAVPDGGQPLAGEPTARPEVQ